MKRFIIKGTFQECRIAAGSVATDLSAILPPGNAFIITDENVFRFHKERFASFPVFVIRPGEESKTADTAFRICRWLMDEGAGRNAFVCGVGGGVVCDLAGFVASIYMRGIDFGFVPTSLLAQVDAAIGGKNGVNLNAFKNIIGTFNQPRFVHCDPSFLSTLPDEELRNGLAEVVKHCLIADKNMFSNIRDHADALLQRDAAMLRKVIGHSIGVKVTIVNRDEFERGERRLLNLGHTWGHAVEKTEGIPHGQAVSIGLCFAARFSEHRGLLSHAEFNDIENLLKSLGLPVRAAADPRHVLQTILKDKKKEDEQLHFVFLHGIGRAVTESISIRELTAFVALYDSSKAP
ncbi:MAG: 3-dehydroquinate synthase [Bacteroidales bacterium]|nr:3-dehydroquinate synthase [Bacteroidales bacterium]